MSARLAAESDLYGRLGGLLHFVFVRAWPAGRPAVPIDPTGSTPCYNTALGWACDLVGYTPASPAAVVDQDILNVPAGLYYTMLDLAEYRLICSALGNYLQADESALGVSQSWASLRQQFQARAEKLEDMYKPYLKATRYQLDFGSIRLPIAGRPADFLAYQWY